MNVGLALEIDASIYDKSSVVIELSDRLKEYFSNRTYGHDVENIAIGIILTAPDGDHLHPVRPLRYRKLFRYPALKIELHNLVEYDLRPNFDVISQMSGPQARAYLVPLLIESIGTLEANTKKFPNFDANKFTTDFTACLSSQIKPTDEVPP